MIYARRCASRALCWAVNASLTRQWCGWGMHPHNLACVAATNVPAGSVLHPERRGTAAENSSSSMAQRDIGNAIGARSLDRVSLRVHTSRESRTRRNGRDRSVGALRRRPGPRPGACAYCMSAAVNTDLVYLTPPSRKDARPRSEEN